MAIRLTVAVLLVALLNACATSYVVRLDTGQGAPLEYRSPTSTRSVKVDAEAFEESLTQLVLHVPLTLRPSQQGWLIRASYPGNGEDTRWQRLMSKSFGGICAPGQRRDNCLSLLDDVMGLSKWDKLGVALGLSLEPLKESISKAVEETLAPQLFYTVIATGLITWATLAANPEPVFTKAAAIISALLLIYLGVEAFLEVVDASRELKWATDRATAWAELEHASQRFANRVGPEVARVLVLAVTVVVSQGMTGGAAWLSSRLSMLPGLPEAAAVGASRVGINLANVGEVEAVAVVGGTVVISLPATAVAMVARNPRGADSKPAALEWYDHHIATDKWSEATHSGGPWTPRFQELFERADMSLNDPANIVRIRGHKGPHPQAYHEEVYRRLREAMQGCRGINQCKDSLKAALKELADEISMEGSKLNKLVTRTK
jgi:hypothetical protein